MILKVNLISFRGENINQIFTRQRVSILCIQGLQILQINKINSLIEK